MGRKYKHHRRDKHEGTFDKNCITKTWQQLRDEEVAIRLEHLKQKTTSNPSSQLGNPASQAVAPAGGKINPKIRPKTPGQRVLWKSLHQKSMTICTGPAGSGKTLLPMQAAAEMLQQNKIKKIVITRPLVGCGGAMGFFPGSVHEKMLPWMAAAIDPLEEYFGKKAFGEYLDEGIIELTPLEIMRGSSFRNSFIFLDEAQNASFIQLKMFLTRLGNSTTMVVSGDVSQSDIDSGKQENSLAKVISRLERNPHEQIGVVRLSREDILRSEVVKWLDERLSDDYISPQSPQPLDSASVYSFDCHCCKEECSFNDAALGEDVLVSYVKCWNCDSVIHIPDDFDPDNPEDCKKFHILKDPRYANLAVLSFAY